MLWFASTLLMHHVHLEFKTPVMSNLGIQKKSWFMALTRDTRAGGAGVTDAGHSFLSWLTHSNYTYRSQSLSVLNIYEWRRSTRARYTCLAKINANSPSSALLESWSSLETLLCYCPASHHYTAYIYIRTYVHTYVRTHVDWAVIPGQDRSVNVNRWHEHSNR